MSQTFVESFTHLKDRPNADKALGMLQRVASLVKPIMRKHNWLLPVLSEFFPESPNLLGLNVNGGQKILLRLRPARAPHTFYDEEHVIGTMLHELTHNVHGPHDEKFYKFLSELEDEYEALKRSGYAGEGFHSNGRRIGENVSHNLPPHVARAKALEAAEKRKNISNILGGARRLGGSVPRRALSPRELAAEAAERRMRDETACGTGDVAQREADKAAKESIEHEVIDLTVDSDPEVIIIDDQLPSGGITKVTAEVRNPSHISGGERKRSRSRPKLQIGSQSKSMTRTPPSSPFSASTPRPTPLSVTDVWSCPRCTLMNDPQSLQCGACSLIRPQTQNLSSGWTCPLCGETGIEHHFWSCRFCGAVKSGSTV